MTGTMLEVPEKFNITGLLVDSHIGQGRGLEAAVFYRDKYLTYEDVYHEVNKTGNMLKSLGVRREQRVLILLPDCPEFIYTFLGAIKIGAVPVPLNTMLNAKDYAYYLYDSRAVALVVAAELLPQVKGVLPQATELKEVIVVGEGRSVYRNYAELVSAASPELMPAETSRDDACYWLYSSGSTGMPKGTIHLHHDMVFAVNFLDQAVTNIRPGDRIFSVSKMFFSYGNNNSIFMPFLSGVPVILLPERPEPRRIREIVEKHRPTVYFGVPSSYSAILRSAEEGLRFDFSSVRLFISAGENLPKTLLEKWQQRFGAEILDGIGSTEAGHIFICNRPGEIRPGSSGRALPGYEFRIVDENDHEVPVGAVGELKLKSDGVAAGYWNKHHKTKKTFVGEWLYTGDQFSIDGDGYFWYSGRSDDMIKVGGIWVSPIEVEDALLGYPCVKECAVVGAMDRDGLIKLAAHVVLNNGYDPGEQMTRELRDFVKTTAGAFKAPRWVNYVTELPRTASGKIQRFKLRESSAKMQIS